MGIHPEEAEQVILRDRRIGFRPAVMSARTRPTASAKVYSRLAHHES